MGQPGFFDFDKRLEAISAKGDPLEALDSIDQTTGRRKLTRKIYHGMRAALSAR